MILPFLYHLLLVLVAPQCWLADLEALTSFQATKVGL